MNFDSGKLNRAITIEGRGSTSDALGQRVNTWTLFKTKWADIRAPNGLGSIRNAAPEIQAPIARYSMRIRYDKSITAAMRVVYEGENYNIDAVQHDLSGKVYTDLVCSVGGSDG